ncbi:hypothetical protein [Streptomyces griseoloalbus]|uniref:hypothetical protein n=1 Tax=Streptomyces griseoloalbus TaxID=67303 RepID=UPI003F53F81A
MREARRGGQDGAGVEAHSLTIYTAEPGSRSEDGLCLLASWAATHEPHPPAQQSPAR